MKLKALSSPMAAASAGRRTRAGARMGLSAGRLASILTATTSTHGRSSGGLGLLAPSLPPTGMNPAQASLQRGVGRDFSEAKGKRGMQVFWPGMPTTPLKQGQWKEEPGVGSGQQEV